MRATSSSVRSSASSSPNRSWMIRCSRGVRLFEGTDHLPPKVAFDGQIEWRRTAPVDNQITHLSPHPRRLVRRAIPAPVCCFWPADRLDRKVQGLGQFFGTRFPVEGLKKPGGCTGHLADRIDRGRWNPDRTGLIGRAAANCLPDPKRRIG